MNYFSPRLRAMAAGLLLVWSAFPSGLSAETNTGISDYPLAGGGSSIAANVVLNLSVEFPTAGAAYSTELTFTENSMKNTYIGYFDPHKCYTYNGQYFVPAAKASVEGEKIGLCAAGSDHFSGNLLNWMSMMAIDIFRSTMTGGNRALGTGTGSANYSAGDTSTLTVLRRARVKPGQNGAATQSVFAIAQYGTTRIVDLNANDLKRLLPSKYETYNTHRVYNFSGYYTYDNRGYDTPPNNNSPRVGSGYGLRVVNEDFGFKIEGWNYRGRYIGDTYTAAVQVCDMTKGLDYLEKNCTAYGRNYKPTGFMQDPKYTAARFAALGYLNIAGNGVNGGVLRARMKRVMDNEVNLATGQFVSNPDGSDAQKSGVFNSGVINYLNKFGDLGGYKTNDPAAELYYAGLRYLRGLSNLSAYSSQATGSDEAKDGFPVITDWQDPLKYDHKGEELHPRETACNKNMMIYIGDTNTHHDTDLPNFFGTSPDGSDKLPTATLLQDIFKQEGITFPTNTVTGSDNSRTGIAALAYWARTRDIRPDLEENQFVKSFMIDVVERGDYKDYSTKTERVCVRRYSWGECASWEDRFTGKVNSFYLAAKYGGFDDLGTGDSNNPRITDRKQWTDETVPASPFKNGMPRNYAPANTPEAMVKGLDKAFSSIPAPTDPSQAGVAVTGGDTIDFGDASNPPLLLQSAFNANGWWGDVIAKRIGYDVKTKKFTGVNTIEWRANSKLINDFRDNWSNRLVYTQRGSSIVRFDAGQASGLQSALAVSSSAEAEKLINYSLGDDREEGKTLRPRNALLGTVVHSSIAAITPQKNNPRSPKGGCAYENAEVVSKRDTHYAFAANDGMLHIINRSGNEKLAYMPAAVLPKLSAYAGMGYRHSFINDGSPMLGELCFGTTAKSVIVGTGGRGTATVYALDVTSLNAPDDSNILWEFNSADDPDLGLVTGNPIVTHNNAGEPIAIVSSGYKNQSNKGHLFILKLDKEKNTPWQLNSNYFKVELGEAGVGAPFGFDADNNGSVDNVYVGDLQGKLWRMDQSDAGTWSLGYGGLPMFTAAMPITAPPAVERIGDKNYVVFGTGKYLSESDLPEAGQVLQNYAYGLFETLDKGKPTNTPVSGAIVEQTISEQEVSGLPQLAEQSQKLFNISKNKLPEGAVGWRLVLKPNQMIVGTTGAVRIRQKKVAEFIAIMPDSSIACDPKSSTALITVDVKNGGEYSSPIFDTNNDGIINKNDAFGGMLMIEGTIAPNGTLLVTQQGTFVATIGSDGVLRFTQVNDLMDAKHVFRRISWREIF
ncbi:MAG: PilC/PilY family type IV pilus protein [Neisseria sp.]|nr:PilC/PilY family type IV pilus protein [Neisseria sp.]